jgi:hypothetical protein
MNLLPKLTVAVLLMAGISVDADRSTF